MSRNLVAHGNICSWTICARKLQLERQTEIISLLLKEFQANASDWLWQTDVDGRLVRRAGTLRRGGADCRLRS